MDANIPCSVSRGLSALETPNEPIYRLMRPCKHGLYTSSTDTTSYRDLQQQLTQWEYL